MNFIKNGMKNATGGKKYMFGFHHKMDLEIGKTLPFRAKYGLIFLDVLVLLVLICLIAFLIFRITTDGQPVTFEITIP